MMVMMLAEYVNAVRDVTDLLKAGNTNNKVEIFRDVSANPSNSKSIFKDLLSDCFNG